MTSLGEHVTVVVPTFNRANLLDQMLESLSRQSARPRIIVCDDASTDETREVCGRFPHVEYCRNERRLGLFANWNRGIQLVDTEFAAIYHDDDMYDSSIVAAEASFLSRHPSVAMVHTACTFIDDEDRTSEPHVLGWPAVMPGTEFRRLLAGRFLCPVAAPSVMVRTASIRSVGGFDERLAVSGDLAAWIEIAATGAIGYIPRPLVAIRRRGRHANPHADFSWALIEEHLAVAARTRREVHGTLGFWFPFRADLHLLPHLFRPVDGPEVREHRPRALGYGTPAIRVIAHAVAPVRRSSAAQRLVRPVGTRVLAVALRLRSVLGPFGQISLRRRA
jgi:glycosyltransferase involved in cell wall biosynthesis